MSNLIRKNIISLADITDFHVCYINVPYRKLASVFIRITAIMFFLFVITSSFIQAAITLPAYIIVLYLYYTFLCLLKTYGFKLVPVLSIIIIANALSFTAAYFIRNALIHLIIGV